MVYSRNAPMAHASSFLVLLLSATVIATLFHALRLPIIVGLILSGLVIGPHGIGIVATIPGTEAITSLGGTLLMFTLGLEFSFRRLKELRSVFFRLGLLQIVLTVSAVLGICVIGLGLPIAKSVFIGFLVALSSTALVMKLLEESRETISPFGNASLSILLFQDLAFIPMVLVTPWLAARGVMEGPSLTQVLLKLVLIPLLLLGGSRYFVPLLFERVARTRSRELFYFCMITVCLGTAALVQKLGLSEGLGAFMAGVMLSESPYGRQVSAEVLPFRDVFLGLFFLAVGMLLDLSFCRDHWREILSLGFCAFLTKTLVTFATFRLNHYPLSISVIAGLILCQVGEFSFILASIGAQQGLLNNTDHQYFLALSILSMMATPFLFQLAPHLGLSTHRLRDAEGDAGGAHTSLHDHAIIIGFGIAGQTVAKEFTQAEVPWHVIELNYNQVKKFKSEGKNVQFGDATRKEVLEAAGIFRARLVVVTVHGHSIARGVLSSIRRIHKTIPVVIRVLYLKELEELETDENVDFVVAEIETTQKIIHKCFSRLNLPTLEPQSPSSGIGL